MRTAIIISVCAVVMCACRSHKETDIRVAETAQTQVAETIQTRTDSRAETRTEQIEAADSIVWTCTADSVVQTKTDGTREVLHRVRRTRTAYKPTATIRVTMTVQQTDTASVAAAVQMQRQTAARSHSESSRGGRPWWLLVVALTVTTVVAVILVRRKILA